MKIHEESREGQESVPAKGSMFGMAVMMMAMCLGTVLTISVASSIGGPVAWSIAIVVIGGLALTHFKFMKH